MAESPPPDTTSTRRPLWVILAALGFVLLIALCLSTGLGRTLLSSAVSALGINLVAPTEAAPTELPTEAVGTEEAVILEVTTPPTEEPTETVEPTEEITPEVTETQEVVVGNGACYAPCDPANSNCLKGLACVPGGSGYICWNDLICNATSVPTCDLDGVCDPDEGNDCLDCNMTGPPCVCGDGLCEQARCNELMQNCPADCGGPPDPCANETCGNGVCTLCPVDLGCSADCVSVTPSCFCGNGLCEPLCGEDDTWCADCPSGCRCGDETCGPIPACGEDPITCPFDCLCFPWPCGNGTCDAICGEDTYNCADCCTGSEVCGDTPCDAACGETILTCPECCSIDSWCGDGVCAPLCVENTTNCSDCCGTEVCPDGICDLACGEDSTWCGDCCTGLYCGDGACQIGCGETPINCTDCCSLASCGDSYCEPLCASDDTTICADCCGPGNCGNLICELPCGENNFTCPSDCP